MVDVLGLLGRRLQPKAESTNEARLLCSDFSHSSTSDEVTVYTTDSNVTHFFEIICLVYTYHIYITYKCNVSIIFFLG